MKEKIFIAIDSGKYNTKGILQYRQQEFMVIFRTKLQKANDLGMELGENSFKIEFEGQQYLLGDAVSENYSNHDLSKESIHHKLAIYTAIVLLMNKAKLPLHTSQIHVAVNAPINIYKNQSLKESYKRYLEHHNNRITMRINEQLFNFFLKDITVCFEGMGLVYNQQQLFREQSTAIIDLGGLNSTFCTFQGLQPDFNSMAVSNIGSSALKGNIERSLVEKYGFSLSANDLERIIIKGFLTHFGHKVNDSADLIKQIKLDHLSSIINYAKQHGYTFNQDQICFVGGGSLLLGTEIRSTFPHAKIEPNPFFSNVKSFLSILKVKYGS
ncbi:hypothetical protein [Jeotgalibacillus sp. JSM ZJ347]|uniref:ParM/StbA family protein n=1 Tax=Jeotgalibacillus sp. JSM ZJ347 TaxID=3342117 RepID=UPI0035A91B78